MIIISNVTLIVILGENENSMFSRPAGCAVISGSLGLKTVKNKAVKTAAVMIKTIAVTPQQILRPRRPRWWLEVALLVKLVPDFMVEGFGIERIIS